MFLMLFTVELELSCLTEGVITVLDVLFNHQFNYLKKT